MLKKSASSVLASLRPSTYPRGYASALRSLRPCWTIFLSILTEVFLVVPHVRTIEVLVYLNSFSAACLAWCLRQMSVTPLHSTGLSDMSGQYGTYTYNAVCMPSLSFCQHINGSSSTTDHRTGVQRFFYLLDGLLSLCEYARDSPSKHNLSRKDIA
jgi:hypothetical protein